MTIKIDRELCVGCGACLKVCLYDAIDLIDRKAVLNDSCIHCSACLESCKFKAILSSSEAAPAKNLASYAGVLVFAETRDQHIAKVTLELLGCGRVLADSRKAKLHAILIGCEVENLVPTLIAHGADAVHVVEDRQLADYRNGPFSRGMAAIISEIMPEIVLIGASIMGRDLAPRVANRLKTGLTADCTGLEIEKESGLLLQTRPAFGGNVMATIICPNHRPQMATVRPGVMKPIEADPKRKGETTWHKITIKEQDLRVIIKEVVRETTRHVDLSSAKIIVSGGRGVGSAAGFKTIQELAGAAGGEVGASRAVVEAGWISHDHQVGQTGKSVSPKLYIACGISGAIQHLAGISGADFVVAINRDANAPIMKAADVGIVGDLHQVAPLLATEIRRMRKEAAQ